MLPIPEQITYRTVGNSVIVKIITESSKATSYDIYRRKKTHPAGNFSLLTNITSILYLDSLPINGTFEYKIKAKSDSDESDYSNITTATYNKVKHLISNKDIQGYNYLYNINQG